MAWKKGRGLLGPLQPLLGSWRTVHSEGGTAAANMACTRRFEAFGKGWIRLDAVWQVGPGPDYVEAAFFGAGEDGALGFFSFTSDGKSDAFFGTNVGLVEDCRPLFPPLSELATLVAAKLASHRVYVRTTATDQCSIVGTSQYVKALYMAHRP